MANYDIDVTNMENVVKGLESLEDMTEKQVAVGFLFQNSKGVYKFYTIPELIEDLQNSLDQLKDFGKEEYNKLED